MRATATKFQKENVFFFSKLTRAFTMAFTVFAVSH